MAWLHTMGQAGEDDGELDTTHTVSSFLVFLSSKPGEGRWLGIARSLRNHSDSGSCPTALVRLLLRSAHKPCWRVPFAFFLESALNSQAVSLYNLWSIFSLVSAYLKSLSYWRERASEKLPEGANGRFGKLTSLLSLIYGPFLFILTFLGN